MLSCQWLPLGTRDGEDSCCSVIVIVINLDINMIIIIVFIIIIISSSSSTSSTIHVSLVVCCLDAQWRGCPGGMRKPVLHRDFLGAPY